MAFLNIFGKKKEAKKFEFPSKAALEAPPKPPVADVGELPEVPEPHEEQAAPAVEEYEVPEQAAEPEREVHREDVIEVTPKKPIFVKVELYRNLLNEVSIAGTTLRESESSLVRLSHVRAEEDNEFDKWQKQVNDIQRKLIFVDKSLFE